MLRILNGICPGENGVCSIYLFLLSVSEGVGKGYPSLWSHVPSGGSPVPGGGYPRTEVPPWPGQDCGTPPPPVRTGQGYPQPGLGFPPSPPPTPGTGYDPGGTPLAISRRRTVLFAKMSYLHEARQSHVKFPFTYCSFTLVRHCSVKHQL